MVVEDVLVVVAVLLVVVVVVPPDVVIGGDTAGNAPSKMSTPMLSSAGSPSGSTSAPIERPRSPKDVPTPTLRPVWIPPTERDTTVAPLRPSRGTHPQDEEEAPELDDKGAEGNTG